MRLRHLPPALLALSLSLTLTPTLPAQSGGELYAVVGSSAGKGLWKIDKHDASLEFIGIFVPRASGLTFHPDGRLLGADLLGKQLVEIDPQTGATTVVGPYGSDEHILTCLASHPDGTLHAVDIYNGRNLVTVDAYTGLVVQVGPLGPGAVGTPNAMAWSSDGSSLVMNSAHNGDYWRVDPATGTLTHLSTVTQLGWETSMANDPETNAFYVINKPEGYHPRLQRIDPYTGFLYTIGDIGSISTLWEGLAFAPSGLFERFCVATPNSVGVPAAIGAGGRPELSANDLTITAAPVPNEPGVFFHGAQRALLPFGNGYLCATGDIVRLGPPATAPAGFATRILDVPLEVGVLGQRHFQYWFRDSAAGGAFFSTSDGLSILFRP